jgi:hypothetical protein
VFIKVILSVLGFLALVALYTLVSGGFSGDEPTSEPKPEAPKVRAWNGQRNHIYNTTFTNRQEALTVSYIKFFNLNRRLANVQVVIYAINTAGKKPSWLTQKNFTGQRPKANVPYTPRITGLTEGSTYIGRVSFKNIPSASLGPKCNDYESAINDPFLLQLKALKKKPVSLTVTAPPAPAGHCFAEKTKKPTKKAVKPVVIQRIKTRGNKTVVFGRVYSKKIKRVLVVVNKKKFKAQARPLVRRMQFRAVFKLKKGNYTVKAGVGTKKKNYSFNKIKVRK